MNCDNFLPALETGGLVRRMLARCHAARCPRCAGVQAAFRAAKQRLAAAEPLSLRARQLWERAAGEVDLRPSTRRVWIPAAAGLGVATCILLVVVAIATRPKSIAPNGRPDVVRSVPGSLDRQVIEEVSSADGMAQSCGSGRPTRRRSCSGFSIGPKDWMPSSRSRRRSTGSAGGRDFPVAEAPAETENAALFVRYRGGQQ